jgi:hypothetical protein
VHGAPHVVGNRDRPAIDALRQVFARDELHDEDGPALDLLERVQGGDAGMGQRRQQARFAIEAGEPFRVGRDGRGRGS